jgi:hypothetical protein
MERTAIAIRLAAHRLLDVGADGDGVGHRVWCEAHFGSWLGCIRIVRVAPPQDSDAQAEFRHCLFRLTAQPMRRHGPENPMWQRRGLQPSDELRQRRA